MMSPLDRLEGHLGDRIPLQYRDFQQNAAFAPNTEYAVDAVGRYWCVEEIFTAGRGDRDIDEAYVSVRHALPPGSFPIVSTLGGFLIIYGESKADPHVYYWDHEQEPGAHEVTVVASSAAELAAIIVEYDETIG